MSWLEIFQGEIDTQVVTGSRVKMELVVEAIRFPVAQILICSHDLCEVTKRVREPPF